MKIPEEWQKAMETKPEPDFNPAAWSALAEKIKRRLPDLEEGMRASDPIGEAKTLLDAMGVTASGDSPDERDIASIMLGIYQGQPVQNFIGEIGHHVCKAILTGDFKALRRMSDRLKRIVVCIEQSVDTPVQKLLDLKHEFIATNGKPPLWSELKGMAFKAFPRTFEAYREDSRQWNRWRKLAGLNLLRAGRPGRPKKR